MKSFTNRHTARPPRAELFGFYYLGFTPDGRYKFSNLNHVARHYGVGPQVVLRWLEELHLSPHHVLHRHFDVAGAQLEIQLSVETSTTEELRGRVDDFLNELDGAPAGRRPWDPEEEVPHREDGAEPGANSGPSGNSSGP